MISQVDGDWAQTCITHGLSTGEGLIHAVRDPVERTNKKGETEIADAGVRDKRLLVIESEFPAVLKVLRRDGNTLSPVCRTAWDGQDVLRILTKNSAESAIGAHISINAHITRAELQFARSELGGGFVNRFLFVCARRSKSLPDGGHLNDVDLAPAVSQLQEAVVWATASDAPIRLQRDDAARVLWREVYEELTTPPPGALGNAVTRAAPHVVRLAAVYAVADQSPTVRVEHLQAALEVWRYCFESARHLFGDATGVPLADRLRKLLPVRPTWMTRTEIRDALGRHGTSTDIDSALSRLAKDGLAITETDRTKTGRPPERWSLLPRPAESPATKATKATKLPGGGVMSHMSHMSQPERDGDLTGWGEV